LLSSCTIHSLITTSTEKIAEKRAEIQSILSASQNPAWRAFATERVSSGGRLTLWARPSAERVNRLRYLIESGQDGVSPPPNVVLVWSATEWAERHGPGFAAWAAKGGAGGKA
jgi:hypothetical protein